MSYDGITPFIQACEEGMLECVTRMLSYEGEDSIDVHEDDEEAFRLACREGQEAVVRLLLSLEGDRRIDVNAHAFYEGDINECSHPFN